MSDSRVFIDTVGLVAMVHTDDELHHISRNLFQSLVEADTRLVTTDWVLAEFLGGCSKVHLRERAIETIRRLRGVSAVEVLPASRISWDRGFELFSARNDKEWSLVDCISMVACRDLGINEIFTRDRDFEQAGFRILLK